MTITTAHPGHHHISGTAVALAATGALLAGGIGFGVAALVLEEAPVPAAPSNIGSVTGGGSGSAGFTDPNGFAGTDREVRAFMHRR